jgi:hypothetical protein
VLYGKSTCIRHPFELVEKLKQSEALKNQSLAARVAAIDAYTLHFGFTDSIHPELTTKIVSEGFMVDEVFDRKPCKLKRILFRQRPRVSTGNTSAQ